MSNDLQADFVRIVPEKRLDVCSMIWHFPFISSEYGAHGRLSRFLLVSLDINAGPGERTLRPRGKKLEQMTSDNAPSDVYIAALTQQGADGKS